MVENYCGWRFAKESTSFIPTPSPCSSRSPRLVPVPSPCSSRSTRSTRLSRINYRLRVTPQAVTASSDENSDRRSSRYCFAECKSYYTRIPLRRPPGLPVHPLETFHPYRDKIRITCRKTSAFRMSSSGSYTRRRFLYDLKSDTQYQLSWQVVLSFTRTTIGNVSALTTTRPL